MAILGAVAAGASIASDGDNTSYGEYLLTDALINASIYAGTQAFAYKRESRAVGDNYLTSIVPALEQQTTVQVDLIDSNETITAIRFEDLREKLQALYTENQRSLDQIATRCAYSHNGAAKSGTWLGECSGGLAAGSGVGVLRDDNGNAIEYYGFAENGQPHGPGYLVVHERGGSYALEGNFTRGEADGVMRVSKPGRGNELRSYTLGQDSGRANPASAVASPFNRGAIGN